MERSRTRFDDWHAIHTLVMTYAERVDAGRFADAAALFEHATYRQEREVDGRPALITYYGTAQVLEYMARTPVYADGTPRTRHVNTNVNIELDGDAATSRCYATVLQQTDTLPLQPIATGRYVDRFEHVDGEWRFAGRLVTGFLAGDVSRHRAAKA
jgi:hypothetical protein